jgi:hypothetical protein
MLRANMSEHKKIFKELNLTLTSGKIFKATRKTFFEETNFLPLVNFLLVKHLPNMHLLQENLRGGN